MYRTAGASAAVPIRFKVGELDRVPDPGSVTWTLRAPDGTPLVANQALAVSGSTAGIVVDATHNATTQRIEHRVLEVNFSSSGHPYRMVLVYKLIPWLPTWVQPAEVRSLVGLNVGELPDEEVDIPGAYMDLEDLLGADTLAGLFQTSPLDANNAVLYQAALASLSSAELRVAKSSTDGPLNFQRFPNVDWERLRGELRTKLASVLGRLRNETSVAPSVIFIVGERPDVITGE